LVLCKDTFQYLPQTLTPPLNHSTTEILILIEKIKEEKERTST
jgi:hypothetical protein